MYVSDHASISLILSQALPVIAVLLPSYRAEYVLGFVLGLTYTFGAVFPTFLASVMSAIAAVVHLVVRPAALRMFRRRKATPAA